MVAPLMTNIDNFNDDSLLKDYLSYQLLKGRLAIILGAGISYYFGLPSWDDLVRRLYDYSGKTMPVGSYTNEELAEYFRTTFFSNDKTGFLNAVHQALYAEANIDFSSLRGHSTLAAIASLTMASLRGSASNIITLNFDNILEIYLRYHGFVVNSIYNDRHWYGRKDVTVYHPHGFIPFDAHDEKSDDIVFDQKSYSLFASDKGKLWRQLVQNIMFRHTCLFIGLSGKDMNLDRFLIETLDKHASKKDNAR